MKTKNRFLILCTLYSVLCTLSAPSISFAADLEPNQPITVDGDKVEYLQDKKMVVASKNIVITYKDMVMTCDSVTVYMDKKEAIAEGNVKITQKDAYFTGDKIEYNFEKGTGRVLDGYVNSYPFYGKAGEMDKLADKEFTLSQGYVTTCDLDKPHYRIRAKRVEIYLEDRVVAYNIFFFVGNVPIMYLPYYIQPIKEQTAHITVMPGKDSDWGYYALNSMGYSFSDICHGRLHLDYRTKKGLAAGVDNFHTFKGFGSGSVRYYWADQNDWLTYDRLPGAAVGPLWRVQARHRWDITPDTTARLELNEQQDQDFIKDYFYKEYEEGFVPDNYVSVITTKPDYTTTLLVRKRLDKYYTVVERLPEFKIDIQNFRIGKTRFYYTGLASTALLNKTFSKTENLPYDKDITALRIDNYNRLSYETRVLKLWSMTPYAGFRETYYSRNRWNFKNKIRGIFDAGIDNSTKIYKAYDYSTNFMNLDINKLRHVITPTANYYYVHQPTISPDNLVQFDEVDAIDTANGIRFALENKLQTKRAEAKGGDLKSVDLAVLIVSTDYTFRLKKGSLAFKSQQVQDVRFDLELIPYPWMFIQSKATIDTQRANTQSYSIDFTASGADKWFLGAGQRYESIESNKRSYLTLDGMYKINDKWRARIYERFDCQAGVFQEQEYTIYRDLHCWIAEITVMRQNNSKDTTLWFVMRLKAFPQMPFGLRQTYSRPRPGEYESSRSYSRGY